MPSPNIAQMYFGLDDAERDIGRGGLLAAGFLRTSAYNAAMSGKKQLIIGRKGSGKSAICLMIEREFRENDGASLITPDEISADEIKRFDLAGIPTHTSKELLWRYIIALHIAKYLLRCIRKKSKTAKTAEIQKRLRQFLIENGEADELSVTERFWKIIDRLKGSISVKAFDIEVGIKGEVASGVKIHDQIDVLEKTIKKDAEAVLKEHVGASFHILIDQVERIWSADSASDSFVVGLLQAAKHVQSTYHFVVCTVFLRTDIYEKLQFAERDKLRSDELRITWDRDSLVQLIEARASASTEGAVTAKGLWKVVFPREIGETEIKRFLTGRTLYRPRDIVQLCNACSDVAKTKGHDAIDVNDVTSALRQYSKWKLLDIQNEWFVNYPFLGDAMLLLSDSNYLFTKDEFKRKFSLLAKDYEKRYPAFQRSLSSDYILLVFFNVGLIGIIREGKTIYECNSDAHDALRPDDSQFVVHPCFREALQCTSGLNLRPFEGEWQNTEESVRSRLAASSPAFDILSQMSQDIIEIRNEISKLNMAEDLHEEIRMNLIGVRNEIGRLQQLNDEVEMRHSLEKIGIFLRDMRIKLIKSKYVRERSDFSYMIDAAIERCDEVAFRGIARRYRNLNLTAS